MKKVFVLASLVFVITAAKSQSVKTHFGVKGGWNLANLQSPNTDYDSKSGFHAGLLAHIHVADHFAIQPEVMYSNQGTEYANAGVRYRTNLSYINVPVLAQYMVGNGFRLQTGPQIGFLLDAKARNQATETNIDVENNFKSTDFSWAFGASYLTNSGFGVDARYNLGLSNINETNAATVKNRVLQLGVFYQFMH